MCNQHGISKSHFIAIVQDAVDFSWLVVGVSISPILKISLAAGLNNIDISIHHVIFRTGQFFHQRAAGAVVPVRMADEENLGVGEMKPEFLNALANQGNGSLQAAVDEDVSLRSGDQVGSQPLASYVIDVAN